MFIATGNKASVELKGLRQSVPVILTAAVLLLAAFGTLAPSASGTTSTSQSTMQGRREPPGLVSGWAMSNVTVMSTSYTQMMLMNSGMGLTLSSISVASSTNGQMMENVAYNSNIVQVEFDHDGGAELVIHSSIKPAAVYADDRLLVESSSTAGLSFNSNAWVYDQTSSTLTVFADPSTITAFYGSTPVPEFPISLAALTMMLATIAAAATVNAVRRKETRSA
jgi:hypothetical protein